MNSPTYIKSIPETSRLVQTSEYVVRWSDMDAFGHINNAKYFTYFEQIRVDWLRSIGAGHSIVVANIGCTFLRAIVYPATIKVSFYLGEPGRKSVDSYYEIRDFDDLSTLYTLGHGTVVWFDHEAGESIEIPAPIRKLIADQVR
ncbi:MAG: thioesterase family protein [Gammaproteobacteria bacterium]